MASDTAPCPVHASNPIKVSAPVPAARRPGTKTNPRMGPPRPDASISKKAPLRGEPSTVLSAAKLPAVATTLTPCSGRPRLAMRRMAPAANPLPMAMRGASGPMTAPRARPARAAKTMPGSTFGVGGPR